jgi:hypothetical protein
MDLSKLPKLSQTPAPSPQADDPAAPAGGGAQQGELFCRCGAPITPGTNFCSNCGASYQEATGGRTYRGADGVDSGGMWVEALLSIAFGVFLLLMVSRGVQYLSATLLGRPFTPYPAVEEGGPPVDFVRMSNNLTGAVTDYKYRDLLDGFWSDMVVTAFALVLILDGILLAFVRKPWAILFSALLITAATMMNLWYVGASYARTNPVTGQAYGLAIVSVMAVIAGIAMAGYQFRLYADLKRQGRR